MKLRPKVIALTLSHVAVFVLGATLFAGHLIQQAFQTAAQDPLHRIGLTMVTPRTEKDPHWSVDAELTSLATTLQSPTAEVIRLVLLLEQDRFAEAATACSALGWPRCDPEALGKMRKAVER